MFIEHLQYAGHRALFFTYASSFNFDTTTEAPSEGTLWVRERGSFPSERADSHAKIIQKESSTLQRDVLWED